MASVFVVALLGVPALATNFRNPTPQMGWNTYNAYSCSPSEAIVKSNAQALVDTGLAGLGYKYVTTDCGWNSAGRDSQNRQIWNTATFPSGGKALGDYIHSLGLKFGVYSGAGYYQCGSTNLPASLGYETIDAEAYAEWGADSLKYDNCFPASPTVAVDYTGSVATAPDRHRAMAAAIDAVDRDILYQVCQWGVGSDVGVWAPAIADSWRIANDIYDAWRSIWRITNEAVPYAALNQTGPGKYADMDMLIVGLHALSNEEEKFHFGMWAILKSPLIIGAAIDSLPTGSMNILSNAEVIAISQDSLAQSAKLVRRFTVEEWDVYAGPLSGNRMVVGIANWRNNTQTVTLNLADIGVSSASARDVWAASNIGTISGTYTVQLSGHELKLLVLSSITAKAAPASAGYYAADAGTLSGQAAIATCGSGQCLPVGKKVGYIGGSGSGNTLTINNVAASSAGTKLVGLDFINYDIALSTAWDWGSNTRNLTIAVNGGAAKRWALPISGGDWYWTGRLVLEVDGFVKGTNKLVFGGDGSDWAPDLVGIELFE